MSNISFNIIRFTTELGSGIAPQRIYNTPSGQLIIPLLASICCYGPNDETLEIIFPKVPSTALANMSGVGPPVWGSIIADPSTYSWYIDLIQSLSTVGFISTNQSINNRIRSDSYAKYLLRKSRRTFVDSIAEEVKFQKLLLETLKIELEYAEYRLQHCSTNINKYLVNNIKSKINSQEVAILIAEMKKSSAEDEFTHSI